MTHDLQPVTDIPRFKSMQEEAAFWDTHNIADLLESGERVQVEFVPKNKLISVRFDEGAAAQLRVQARRRGLKPTTLIRIWVMERLNALSSESEPLSHHRYRETGNEGSMRHCWTKLI